MKKLLLGIVLLVAAMTFSFASPALAGDAAHGGQIFTAKCASCHMGGKNVVDPTKTLSKQDLQKNGRDSIDAIIAQVTKGKNAMPAFGGQLSDQDIEDVATYVLAQADKGW